MRSYKYHYTYLITNLSPTNKKQFYIGVKSCDCPPTENINYMGSSFILNEDIKTHGVANFEKIIIAEFNSREKAETHENALHVEHNVALNPIFYNQKNGNIGFHVTKESILKCTQIFNDPLWKVTTGRCKIEKQAKKRSSANWKETTGRKTNVKHSKTINNPLWKETVGKEQSRKHSETLNNRRWLSTIGIEKNAKHSKTINDPVWKESTGKDKIQKYKNTRKSKEWRKNNSITCEHCGKIMLGKSNYVRWHGDNCKQKGETICHL